MKSSKAQLAAVSALKLSLLIFLAPAAIIPVVSLINRVFDGSWFVNWREMILASAILSGCIFCFVFLTGWLELSAAVQRKRKRVLIFPAVMWLRGVYLFAILMGLTTMVGAYREGDEWWVVALPFGFVLLGVFAWPRAIRITDVAVCQRGKLFLMKRIARGEVEDVAYDPSSQEIVVNGKDGARIVHTMSHSDGARFLSAMKAFSGKETVVLEAVL